MILVSCNSLLYDRWRVTLMCTYRKGGIQALCIDCSHQTKTQRMNKVFVYWSQSFMNTLHGENRRKCTAAYKQLVQHMFPGS